MRNSSVIAGDSSFFVIDYSKATAFTQMTTVKIYFYGNRVSNVLSSSDGAVISVVGLTTNLQLVPAQIFDNVLVQNSGSNSKYRFIISRFGRSF